MKKINEMKRLLVTGASGFLGWHISKKQGTGWQTVGVWNENQSGIFPKTPSIQIDLTDKDAIWHSLKEVKPEAVLHLAAISGTATCEQEPEKSHAINVQATAHLAEMCADRKIRLLFTSSEQVFDGGKGTYGEDDSPNPKNVYGQQKLEAERLVAAIHPDAATIRISVLFGKAGGVAQCFLEQWVESWRNMVPVTAFHDEVRSFLSGSTAADGLFHLLQQGASGLFHLGGAEGLSRTDFAEQVKEIFKLDHAAVKSRSQKEVEVPAFRPPDLSLNCRKISSTGFVPKNVVEELRLLKQEFDLSPPPILN